MDEITQAAAVRLRALIFDWSDDELQTVEVGSLRRILNALDALAERERRIEQVRKCFRALGRCEDEFLPDYPEACCEHRDALDTAIVALLGEEQPHG